MSLTVRYAIFIFKAVSEPSLSLTLSQWILFIQNRLKVFWGQNNKLFLRRSLLKLITIVLNLMPDLLNGHFVESVFLLYFWIVNWFFFLERTNIFEVWTIIPSCVWWWNLFFLLRVPISSTLYQKFNAQFGWKTFLTLLFRDYFSGTTFPVLLFRHCFSLQKFSTVPKSKIIGFFLEYRTYWLQKQRLHICKLSVST